MAAPVRGGPALRPGLPTCAGSIRARERRPPRRRPRERDAGPHPGRVERLRVRRVRGGGRSRRSDRAPRGLPALRLSRDGHRAARTDALPAAPRRRRVLHRRAADARHRRRQHAAHPADRHHAPVRRIRRVLARHELDDRRAPAARLRDLEPGARKPMTRSISVNIRALALALAAAFLVSTIGVTYWTVAASDELAKDPFNPRLVALTSNRPRGAIVDRGGVALAVSERSGDRFVRSYKDRSL